VDTRQLIQSLTLTATARYPPSTLLQPAPAQAKGYVAKATAFNHVSYQVADYKKCRRFLRRSIG